MQINNYKLTIQYDGTAYSGWQIQENAVTVQAVITKAIETITRKKINLIGSGRTDTGVHALGQAANFRIDNELKLQEFVFSLNCILPKDISVTNIEKVDESFHSRFDAKKRSYIYLISNFKSPFYDKYSFHYHSQKKCEVEQLNFYGKELIGEYDFTSFAKKNSAVENRFCTIYDLHWRGSQDLTFFYIEANRFLHGMVRTIVGSILFAAKNKTGAGYLKELLIKKDRREAAEAVPAKGLFLYKVRY